MTLSCGGFGARPGPASRRRCASEPRPWDWDWDWEGLFFSPPKKKGCFFWALSIVLLLVRSLLASRPIQEGDCILQLPHTAQLTQDKLPQEVRLLLDDDPIAGDTAAKVAVLLMMEQHLGHESGWAPYVTSLPSKDHMHNMMFWDLNELHTVTSSSIYDETIQQKEHVLRQFSAVKPALENFPHLFGEIKLEDFMHASALVSSRAWQTLRGVSLTSLTMTAFLILY